MSLVDEKKRMEHHDRMDETLQYFITYCHMALDEALDSGALNPPDIPDNFLLVKSVLTVCCETKQFYSKDMKALVRILKRHVG